MSVNIKDIDKNEFMKHVRSCIGIKFQHQGRTEFGLDCAGVPIISFKKCGVEFIDLANYDRRPNQDDILNTLYNNGFFEIKFSDINIGDILLIEYDNNIQHIAVVSNLNPTYIIHAITDKKVSEHILSDNFKIRRCFRF